MRVDRKSMLLYAVTDRSWVGTGTLKSQVEQAIDGGATCVQLREKNMPREEFLAEAKEILPLCREHGVPLIINDDAALAAECGADGVHVGQDDMNAGDVRSIVGKDMIIGVSAQTVEQAVSAEKAGADYLGVGAVFSTSTKLDAHDVSLDTLREITKSVSIPVVAIGGINESNMARLKGSGIAGVALVSAIFAAPDIKAACERLKRMSSDIISRKN